jgi:hypothetical protein
MRAVAALALIVVVVIVIYLLGVEGLPGAYLNKSVTYASSSAYTVAPTSSAKTTTVGAVAAHVNGTRPEVVIISPKNLSTVNGLVNISADVVDSAGIRQVQFYLGNNLSWTSNSVPYYYMWNTTGLKEPEYMITVKAYDYNGSVGQASILVDIGLVQHGK